MDTESAGTFAQSFLTWLSLLWALLTISEVRWRTKHLSGAYFFQLTVAARLLADVIPL